MRKAQVGVAGNRSDQPNGSPLPSKVNDQAGRSGARPAGNYAPYVPERCTALKAASGEACNAKPVSGERLCFGHLRSTIENGN